MDWTDVILVAECFELALHIFRTIPCALLLCLYAAHGCMILLDYMYYGNGRLHR